MVLHETMAYVHNLGMTLNTVPCFFLAGFDFCLFCILIDSKVEPPTVSLLYPKLCCHETEVASLSFSSLTSLFESL